MTDRLLAANAHVAATELAGKVEAPRFTDGTWHRIGPAVVDLLDAPAGHRNRQLLHGWRVRVLEVRDGWAFLQSARDGYVGYMEAGALAADAESTHAVTARATHLYPAPELKVHETGWLSQGSHLRIAGAQGSYLETDDGQFVPTAHVAPLAQRAADPVEVCRIYLGTPYLWGGNSAAGIDCSGLVQAACLACGIDCPGDSDLQRDALGTRLPDGTPPQKGDLFFWKGHVAIASDAQTLIHANAHHMAVAHEPLDAAVARIAAHEYGALLAHQRLA